MSIEYAILGLLTRGPMHGYAIGKQIDRLLRGIWPVNPGQVYATLERLARDGLIAAAVPAAPPAPQARRQAGARAGGRAARAARRPVTIRPYVIRPAGRRRLRRWLDRPVACDVPRSSFEVRLLLRTWAHDAPGIAALLAEHRARCTSLRRTLERAAQSPGRQRLPSAGAPGADAAGAPTPGETALVVRAALRHLDAELDWMALIEPRLRYELAPHPSGVLD